MLALRHILCALALIGAAASAAGRVEAQTYPDRLIKMVVPYPAGGPIDITARLVVQRLGPILGQTVIIENRGGAGGALGTKAVAAAEPDGYTLLFGNASALVVGPAVYRFRDYDTIKQFTPVAKVTEGYEVLVVAPDFPPKNVQELVAYAKANPGKLNYASTGNGTSNHLSFELFKSMTGTNVTHIPYKGSAPAVTDLIAGQVQVMFDNTPNVLPHVRAGKLKALGISSKSRSAFAPEIPTVDEAGVPGYDVGVWFGVLTVAGTPREVVQRLNTEMVKILTSAEVKERFGKMGVDVVAGSPEQFSQLLKSEVARWAKVIQDAGIKAD